MAYQERANALPGTPGIGGNKNIIKPAPQMMHVTARKSKSDTLMISLVSIDNIEEGDKMIETPVFEEKHIISEHTMRETPQSISQ
eukprot:scaffold6579_cov55-Cyclotella_meneghiniana.AAC.6